MERTWRIELLGGLRVIQGSERVTSFRVRWSASLLAYLAYHRHQSFRREVIIECLWPELEPSIGGGRFRQALHYLRERLEPSASCRGTLIVIDGGSVLLDPDAYHTDVAEFQLALRTADRARHDGEKGHWLKRAVELYRGDLLPEFYEEWLRQPRLHLSQQYHHALDQWIAVLAEDGDVQAAVDLAVRAVRSAPLREESHEQLIRLLAAAGQPEAALRQYQELEQLLKTEAAGTPSPEIADFARVLQTQSAAGGSAGRAFSATDLTFANSREIRSRAEATLDAGRAASRLGQYQRASVLLQESMRQFRAVGASGGLAHALEAMGGLAYERHESEQARALFEEGLVLHRAQGDRRRTARLLRRLANVERQEGNCEIAAALAAQGQAISAELGDMAAVADTLAQLGRIAAAQGDPARESECYATGLAIYRNLGDPTGVAVMQSNLGRLELRRREHDNAKALYQQSLEAFRETHNRRGIAQSLVGLMEVALRQNEGVQARAYGEESLAIYRAMDDLSGAAFVLLQLGLVALLAGDLDRSRACYHESETLYRRQDKWAGVARALIGLGNTAYAQGHYVVAGRYYRESIVLYQEMASTKGLAAGVQRLARVIGHRGDVTRAARLFGAVESLGDALGQNGFCADRFDDQAQIQSLRESLGETQFAAAWAEGRAMSLEEAVAAATRV